MTGKVANVIVANDDDADEADDADEFLVEEKTKDDLDLALRDEEASRQET